MKSPTSRSLAYVREGGWTPAVVEQNRRIGRRAWKVDLYGFIDILALKPGRQVLAIQATSESGGHVAERVAKIRAAEHYATVRDSGWTVEVHGWRKPCKSRRAWALRVVTVCAHGRDVEEVAENASLRALVTAGLGRAALRLAHNESSLPAPRRAAMYPRWARGVSGSGRPV